MQNKTKIAIAIACILAMSGITTFYSLKCINYPVSLLDDECDALTSCEITSKKGEVVFSCSGENTCSSTHLGYTLTCDGTKD